jgi:NAD(P)-dependent dehydrogenase (short-subunit alcohol dehydrogenase family)
MRDRRERKVDLKHASALVTGGAGGFGEATVRRLAAAGVKVVIADLAADKGKALVDAHGGDKVRFMPTDVMDEDSVRHAVAAAQELAPLRVAVVVHGGPVAGRRIVNRQGEPIPLETFRRTVDVFLGGTFNVLSKAAAAMTQNEPLESGQRGVVIMTASIAGFEGLPGQSDYGAAKAGVIGLALNAARDLAPTGVRVMTIAPGTFLTPAFGMTEEEAEAKYGGDVPNPKRMGRPDEYARLAMQIVENDYLNGTTIRIDGALRFGL